MRSISKRQCQQPNSSGGTTGRLPFGWDMISANLNASIMMIADKASDLIRGRTAPEAVVVGSIAG
jgi:hypothetical protein